MEDRHTPVPGEIYKHFKGNYYQIVAIAIHSGNLEEMAVYQALYGDFKTYVRPLNMFMSPVDRKKYPDVKQRYRFELIDRESLNKQKDASETSAINDFESLTKETGDIPVIDIIPLINTKAVEEEKIEEKIEKNVEENIEVISKDNETTHATPNKVHSVYDDTLDETGVSMTLIKFLDADSFTEKLEIYNTMRDIVDSKMMNDIAVALGISLPMGDLEEQYYGIKRDLSTFARFEREK